MTECWRAELRKYNVCVFPINPSEVITAFARRAGFPQKDNPSKLQSEDIAHMIKAVLEMNDRGFTPRAPIDFGLGNGDQGAEQARMSSRVSPG